MNQFVRDTKTTEHDDHLQQTLINQIRLTAPHAHIDDVTQWVDRVVAQEPDRALTYVKRLAGLSSYDISVIHQEYVGGRHPFSSARDIVAQKLCKNLPLIKPDLKGLSSSERKEAREAHGNMLRSYLYKREAVKQFKEDYQLRSSMVFETQLERFHQEGWTDHPWAQCDLPELLVDTDQQVVLADFRAPMKNESIEEWSAYGVPDHYKAGLAFNAGILRDVFGLKVDLDNVFIVAISPSMAITPIRTSVTPALIQSTLDAGDRIWNDYVLNATMPELQSTKSFQNASIGSFKPELQKKVYEFVAYKRLASQTTKQTKVLQGHLFEQIASEGWDLTAFDKTAFGPVTISSGQRKGLNSKRINQMLANNETISSDDLAEITTVSHFNKVTVPATKKSEYRPMIDELDEVVGQLIREMGEMGHDLARVKTSPEPAVPPQETGPGF